MRKTKLILWKMSVQVNRKILEMKPMTATCLKQPAIETPFTLQTFRRLPGYYPNKSLA